MTQIILFVREYDDLDNILGITDNNRKICINNKQYGLIVIRINHNDNIDINIKNNAIEIISRNDNLINLNINLNLSERNYFVISHYRLNDNSIQNVNYQNALINLNNWLQENNSLDNFINYNNWLYQGNNIAFGRARSSVICCLLSEFGINLGR
jgi:hypothetical protein